MADRHKNANLWFGKNGFIEYQFSLPWSGKLIAMEVMRDFERHFTIYLSGAKVFGNKSKGLIDFTQEGFTVTLTTRPTSKLYSKLIEFDKKILQNGGRIYLAKDSRLDSDIFARMYPRVEELRSLRSKYNLEMFSSDLSRRLKI
jgi:decaprenylphospho-beta-D-ribofuranose 2-oxidase